MLHRHPWWLPATGGFARTPPHPAAPHEPPLWDPEEWLDAQARFWDGLLESNRAWWKTVTDALPAVTWPQPPVVVPPAPQDAGSGEGEPSGERPSPTPTQADKADAVRQRLRGARWRHHEASGAAQARLERLRKR